MFGRRHGASHDAAAHGRRAGGLILDAKEQVRKKRIQDLEAVERDLLAKQRVIEQRKLSLKTYGVPAGDSAWLEAERALATNKRELASVRNELYQARRLT